MSYKVTFIEGPPELYGINGTKNYIHIENKNPDDDHGINGDIYVNSESKEAFNKKEGKWIYNRHVGINNNKIIAGLGQPYAFKSEKGDVYINKIDAEYYLSVGDDGWLSQGNLLEALVVPNKQILTGNGSPSNALGMDGDQYINNINKDIYIKENGIWVPDGNLQGPPGQSGSKILTGNGQPSNGIGMNGDYYINNINKDYYLKINGIWVLQANLSFNTIIFTGSGQPDNSIGSDGDQYINIINNDYYRKQNGIWVLTSNLTGQPGQQGINGRSIIADNGPPNNSIGEDGDYYINNLNGDYYQKVAGLWQPRGNLTGPVGSPGVSGSKILVGNGVPDISIGEDGDYYINNLNEDYYQKVGGVWQPRGNLDGPIGEQGDSGSQILTGTGAPLQGDGADGDYYINVNNNDYYLKNNGIWNLEGNLTGPRGGRIFAGNGVPSNLLGFPGDYYIDNLNKDVYVKSGLGWGVPVENIQGPPGQAGQAGSEILTGTGVPLPGDGTEGDYYIDNTTKTYYRKEGGIWVPKGSLLGPQGPVGNGGFPVDEIFGDGSDGDFISDQISALPEDRFYNIVTLGDTAVYNTNGYRLFVREALELGGFLGIPTRNASQFTGGSVTNTGTVGFGGAGANGTQKPVVPGVGMATFNVPRAGFFNGGNGGPNSGTPQLNGSLAGATTPVPITDGSDGPLRNLLEMADVRSLTGARYNGGSGGGAGPGVNFEFNDYYGGGGGGGGGVVAIFAKTIVSGSGPLALIGAQGGNGAGGQPAGASNVRGGGGGGGGGGVLVYVTTSLTGTSISAASVQGGIGGGSGVTRGTDGQPGIIYGFIVNTV
ncbi:Collagen-like protein [Orpheovirus IHUMI-LCC2]|uniref:Collagen-like protein n=1 Tax=Orpheovirus IHUMI-LCC2 TaxID=2023057 RepID=A0A2I2L5F3_9VIRU|nr:Collagen-like protein [Orpheovirus IHUMI-LCC2]SNW62689.1 Collagen-like protein [Orpheovirus IHUMI-LCC2]